MLWDCQKALPHWHILGENVKKCWLIKIINIKSSKRGGNKRKMVKKVVLKLSNKCNKILARKSAKSVASN